MDGRRSIGGLEGQAKVLGGWNSVDKNSDVDLHHEYRDGAVEDKEVYKQMKSSEDTHK